MKNEEKKNDKKINSLDELIEVLDQDQLRHVGGARPKGKPTVKRIG